MNCGECDCRGPWAVAVTATVHAGTDSVCSLAGVADVTLGLGGLLEGFGGMQEQAWRGIFKSAQRQPSQQRAALADSTQNMGRQCSQHQGPRRDVALVLFIA